LVKNELRKQWNLESDLLRQAKEAKNDDENEMEMKQQEKKVMQNLPEEWKAEDATSEHPNAAKMLKEHLYRVKAYDKL